MPGARVHGCGLWCVFVGTAGCSTSGGFYRECVCVFQFSKSYVFHVHLCSRLIKFNGKELWEWDLSCWVCTQPLSEVWESTTRILVLEVEMLLLLLFYWWVTCRGRWQLQIWHWRSRGFWGLEGNWQHIKVGLIRRYCGCLVRALWLWTQPLWTQELEPGSSGGSRGACVWVTWW